MAEMPTIPVDNPEAFDVLPQFRDDQNPGRPYTPPEKFTRKMEAEDLKKAAKAALTWADRSAVRSPDERPIPRDKVREGVDRRLGFIGPIGGVRNPYYIQNGKILHRGKSITLEEVPETVTVRVRLDKDNIINDEIPIRGLVRDALGYWREAALSNNPLLCRVCAAYPARGPEDFVRHMYQKHPAEFQAEYGEAPAVEETPAVEAKKKPAKTAAA